jgi:tripartite-type tricarboxylate transporter receptor subunit TctC
MLLPRSVERIFRAAAVMLVASSACGQNYPNKPVRIITSPIGSATDFAARTVAQGLTANIGQQVIVDNRPSGVIPGQLASSAPADGYTLLASGSTL